MGLENLLKIGKLVLVILASGHIYVLLLVQIVLQVAVYFVGILPSGLIKQLIDKVGTQQKCF